MFFAILITLLILSSIVVTDHAQHLTYFVRPSARVSGADEGEVPTYSPRKKSDLKWSHSFCNYEINFGQVQLSERTRTERKPEPSGTNQTSDWSGLEAYAWKNHDFNLNNSNPFYLTLMLDEKADGAIASHPFNMGNFPATQPPTDDTEISEPHRNGSPNHGEVEVKLTSLGTDITTATTSSSDWYQSPNLITDDQIVASSSRIAAKSMTVEQSSNRITDAVKLMTPDTAISDSYSGYATSVARLQNITFAVPTGNASMVSTVTETVTVTRMLFEAGPSTHDMSPSFFGCAARILRKSFIGV